ncbi:MAG: DUF3820 family protein [Chlamydiota bacterium]
MIEKTEFICLDCETTGLDIVNDHVIEVAAVRFTFEGVIDSFETLINPGCPISLASQAIHHISDEMVVDAPPIEEVLPTILKFVEGHIIVGHGIGFDMEVLAGAAQKKEIPCSLRSNKLIDTLRLARLYGESPVNSLDSLRQHFNIEWQGAHRAMADVQVNIEIFKKLSTRFKTVGQLFDTLSKPIQMRLMPLGKYKGREFKDLPLDYLRWAVRMDFDDDLLFSLKTEMNKRRKGDGFELSGNPFSQL